MPPLYERRFRGERARDEFRHAASDAGAMSRAAASFRGEYSPHLAASRDRAIGAARQQTVMHHQIRRGYLQDAAQDQARWDAQVGRMADRAMENYRLGIRQRESIMDRAQRDRQFNKQQRLRREESGERTRQFDELQGLQREKFGEDVRQEDRKFGEDIRQADRQYGLERDKIQESQHDDKYSLERDKFEESKRQTALEAKTAGTQQKDTSEKARRGEKFEPEVMDRIGLDLGFNTNALIENDGTVSAKGRRFYHNAEFNYKSLGMPYEKAVQKASEDVGLQTTKERIDELTQLIDEDGFFWKSDDYEANQKELASLQRQRQQKKTGPKQPQGIMDQAIQAGPPSAQGGTRKKQFDTKSGQWLIETADGRWEVLDERPVSSGSH